MKQKTLPISVAAVSFGLCLTLTSAPGLAQDRKTYHGSECNSFLPENAGQFEHHVGGIYNRHSTLTLWITCPIVRDNWNNTNGFDGTIWVRVNRNPGTAQRLVCYLYSLNAVGGITKLATTSWAGSGWQWLGLDVVGAGASVAWGSAALACGLPPRSLLLSYSVPEFPNTNN